MPKVMPITTALAAVLAAVPAVAQVTSNRDSARSPWPVLDRETGLTRGTDTTYIRQVIRGNFTEVSLGRLAEDRADDSAVEDFAERMVSDHNSINEQWGKLARDNDMSVGLEFRDAGKEAVERLEDLDGAEFDQAYMAEMIRHHEEELAGFQRMATSARSSEVRQLASSGMSTTQEHLALAREVGRRVGISTTAGRVGGVAVPTTTPSDSDRARRTTSDRAPRDARDDDRDDRDSRDARSRPSLGAADRTFVEGTLSDHLMHVRLAKRAQREGRTEAIRDFAERMEKDFTRWTERWESFADRRAPNVTTHLKRQHREKLERLDKASERKDFDRAYAAIVSEHLESLVEDFREERKDAKTEAVRRLVDDELPMLRQHLATARRLERQASERR